MQRDVKMVVFKPGSTETEDTSITSTPPPRSPLHSAIVGKLKRSQDVEKSDPEKEDVSIQMAQVNLAVEAVNKQVSQSPGAQSTQISQHNDETTIDDLEIRSDIEGANSNIRSWPKQLREDNLRGALLREGAIVVPGHQNPVHAPNNVWTRTLERAKSTMYRNHRKYPEMGDKAEEERVSGKTYDLVSDTLEDMEARKVKFISADNGSDQIQDSEDGNPFSSHSTAAETGRSMLQQLLAPENILYARNYIGMSQMPKICRTTVNCLFAFLYLITQREWNSDLLKIKMRWFLQVDKLCLYFPSKIRHLSHKEVFLDKLDDAMLKIGEMIYNERNPDGPQWDRPRRIKGYNTQHPQYKDIRIPFIGWNKREDKELLIFTKLVLGKKERDLEIDKSLVSRGKKPTQLAAETRRLAALTNDLPGLLKRIDELRGQLDREVTKQLEAAREAKKDVPTTSEQGSEELNEEEWIERHTYYYYNDTAKQKRLVKKAHETARLASAITQIGPAERQTITNPPQAKLETEKSHSVDVPENTKIKKPAESIESEPEIKPMNKGKGKGKEMEIQDFVVQKEDEGFVTADECPSEQKSRKVSKKTCQNAGPFDGPKILGHPALSKIAATPTMSDPTRLHSPNTGSKPQNKPYVTKIPHEAGKLSEAINSSESSTPPRSRRIKIVIVSKPGSSIPQPPTKKKKTGGSGSHLATSRSGSDNEEKGNATLAPQIKSKVNRPKRKMIIESDDDDDYVPEKGGFGETARNRKKTARRYRN